MVIDVLDNIIKGLEERERSYISHSKKVEDTKKENKETPAEPIRRKTVLCSYSNSATNWWLALIAFLLFFMLCTNPNFE